MARTVKTIYQEMLDEKTKYSQLNGLTNNQDTAIWRTMFYVVAVVIATFEQLQDVFITELNKLAKTLPQGTIKWYTDMTFKYQEGYEVIWNRITGRSEYPVEDETAQIIKVATAQKIGSKIVVKCAKDDGDGGIEELTTAQLSSVNAYMNAIQFAGPLVNVTSFPADRLKIRGDILVNKTLINVDGQSTADNEVYPVEDAINDYLTNLYLDNFNSVFRLINLIDAIQAVPGVIDVKFGTVEARNYTASDYYDVFDSTFNTYTTFAGYMVIDSSFPLRDNLTYSN